MNKTIIFLCLVALSIAAPSKSPSRTPSPSVSPSASPSSNPSIHDFAATKDSWGTRGVLQGSGQCVYNGGLDYIEVGQGFFFSTAIPTWLWIAFDTTSLSTSNVIQSATITLTGCGSNPANNGNTVEVYTTDDTWSESTVTASTHSAPYNCPAEPTLVASQGTFSDASGKLVMDLTSLFQDSITNGVTTSLRLSVSDPLAYQFSTYCSKEATDASK